MQADDTSSAAFDARRVENRIASPARALSGLSANFAAPQSDEPILALRPTAQSLIGAHRPLAFLWQQGLIALSPLASLLGVEIARPSMNSSTTRSGDTHALE